MTPTARAADRVHANWQRQPGCGRDAMCDQIISTTGESCGSRYYPRCVTSYLWLEQGKKSKVAAVPAPAHHSATSA